MMTLIVPFLLGVAAGRLTDVFSRDSDRAPAQRCEAQGDR